jgi:hypothetical protein
VTWKDELQLRDLDAQQSIEVTCRRCARTYYEQASALLEQGDAMRYVYLDEMEKRLACKYRGCLGPVRITLMDNTETEGFVGGLP